jgi:polyhydroxybutyrate depolymerase
MKNHRTGIIALCVVVLGMYFASLLAGSAYRRFQEGASGRGNKPGSLDIGGRTRRYLLHAPPAYDGKKPLPLVLVLHGGGQSPESAERMSGMSAKADKEDFLVVYPSGTGRSSRMPTWNSGNCCGYAMQNNVDDVTFLRALIDKLEHDYSADPRRIFVTGISNGGMMSYRIGCELADKIAAIAPAEGAQDTDCRPSGPVSVIVFHGSADRLVPFNGGSTPFQIGPKRTDNSVANAVAFWVKNDGCSPTPKHEENSAVHTDIYSGCKNGTGVALYAIQGGRHLWPGSRISGNNVAATELMWSFFLQHPKP